MCEDWAAATDRSRRRRFPAQPRGAQLILIQSTLLATPWVCRSMHWGGSFLCPPMVALLMKTCGYCESVVSDTDAFSHLCSSYSTCHCRQGSFLAPLHPKSQYIRSHFGDMAVFGRKSKADLASLFLALLERNFPYHNVVMHDEMASIEYSR